MVAVSSLGKEMANAFAHQNDGEEANIWSAADKGDTEKVLELLERGRDVNCRNCLGCTPLLYACGSGHIDTVSSAEMRDF